MQIGPEQGQFLALLIELIAARHCIEVGTFTGYSTLCVALALPPDGRIVACDINPETTAIARRYWNEAGVAEKIDLHIAPALDTLDALLEQDRAESFDFAFIDADKTGYLDYYEEILRRLSPTGLIMVDNVLWDGKVLDPTVDDPNTESLRAFNDHVAHDERVTVALLPLADGITLVTKRR